MKQEEAERRKKERKKENKQRKKKERKEHVNQSVCIIRADTIMITATDLQQYSNNMIELLQQSHTGLQKNSLNKLKESLLCGRQRIFI